MAHGVSGRSVKVHRRADGTRAQEVYEDGRLGLQGSKVSSATILRLLVPGPVFSDHRATVIDPLKAAKPVQAQHGNDEGAPRFRLGTQNAHLRGGSNVEPLSSRFLRLHAEASRLQDAGRVEVDRQVPAQEPPAPVAPVVCGLRAFFEWDDRAGPGKVDPVEFTKRRYEQDRPCPPEPRLTFQRKDDLFFDTQVPPVPNGQARWEEGRRRFPSPVLGLAPGEYHTEQGLRAARKGVYWAREQMNNLNLNGHVEAPTVGPGRHDFANAEELRSALRAMVWSRARGWVADEVHEYLKFLESAGAHKRYNQVLLSDFGGATPKSLSWDQRKKLFPSPKLGQGPGACSSRKELEGARRAVNWARDQVLRLPKGGLFPAPRLGSGPGEFSCERDVEAVKRAVMWSRMCGQVGKAAQRRLKELDPDSWAFSDVRAGILSQPSAAMQARLAVAAAHFPSPVFGSGPGEYPDGWEFEEARLAVRWARDQAAMLGPCDRFPAPQLGVLSDMHDSAEARQAAADAIMWSRVRAQIAVAHEARLKALLLEGANRAFDHALLSDVGPGRGSEALGWDELRERFPSPVFGQELGEYSSVEAYEAAKKAVNWAREQARGMCWGDRFPSPPLGNGPGEFATTAELEAAKRAVMWSRLQGQESAAAVARLSAGLPEGADFDGIVCSAFGGLDERGRRWENAKQHFPSPKPGHGPGEYSSPELLEAAKKAVFWARERLAGLDAGAPFPSPKVGLGPGEFATAAEVAVAKKDIVWSRLRHEFREDTLARLQVA